MKKLSRKVMTALLVFALLGTTACSNGIKNGDESTSASAAESTAASETASNGHHKFGFTAMDLTDPFHVTIRDTIKKAAEAKGDQLISADGAMDVTKQNNAIEDMITQGIDVLFLNPVSADGILPALEACKKANVKVINIDSAVSDLSFVETYIASDNYQAGYNSGKEMIKQLPDGGSIALIDNPIADSVVQREKGLRDAIKDSKLKIVAVKAISKYDEVMPATDDILQAHSDLVGFWGLNDTVSLTILASCKSAKMNNVKVFSVDGSPAVKASIKDGGVTATSAQSPKCIGEKAAEACYTILNGGTVDKKISVETFIINKDNVDKYGVNDWQ